MAVKKTRDIDCFFNPCPPGYYCGPDNKCKPQAKKPGILGNTSAKIGAGLIGAGVAALGTKVAKDIKENRAAKKAAKKTAELPKQKKGGEKKMSLVSAPVIMMKKGGSTDKKWIQKAINPAHKGYCTPMSKPTCTPKRKALAMTLKKMAKKR
jgi:hypothetical protein